MKVLYFTRDYTTHDRRFLAALAQTGHKVYYLRLERRGLQLEDRPLPPGIELVPWVGGQQPARLADGPRLLAGLKRVIRSVQPDLIHAGPIQTCGLLAALSSFRPLVSMSWGSDLLRDAGRSRRYRWATRYTLAHSDALIGDCDAVRQKAIEFGMPDERIVTYPWGVDLRHFSPGGEPHPAGTFTLLSTRGWEPIYGVDVIAHAFVRAVHALGDSGPALRLIMLGGGSQAALLRDIFTRGGVLDRVRFPGQVSYTDLPGYHLRANLYLSASHSDGASISLLEAMACGRPVLVSDIPGNREFVTPGENGWLFPDSDASALAGAILQAVQASSSLSEMGRCARRLAEERADWDKNFQGLLQAYDIACRAVQKTQKRS